MNKELEILVENQAFSLMGNSDRQEQIRTEIEEIYNKSVKASIFCSKACWYSEGERNSKYFFRLEKQRSNTKTMTVFS